MPARSLELTALKKIPAEYKKEPGRIYDGPPSGLAACYGKAMDLRDSYHVILDIRSRYCSMDELKAWIQANHPEMDLAGTWSMTGGYNGHDVVVTDRNGNKLRVPNDMYRALETDHVNKQSFECPYSSWSLDLGYSDSSWLEPLLPGYVSDKEILELARLRIRYAQKSDPDGLAERLNEADCTGRPCPDIIGFLADGLSWARKNRTALYARLTD